MPIETIPGTEIRYHLTAFDARGRERQDDPDGLMSQRAIEALAHQAAPITDVFLFAHGWQGDVPSARAQFGRWVLSMADRADDIARMRQARPDFRAVLIGLHWPSLPWGDEVLRRGPVSFAAEAAPTVERLVDDYAARLADTPTARAALRTILTAAEEMPGATTLPEVRDAYLTLDREAGLASDGVGAPPGGDRLPFDPERAVDLAVEEEEAVAFDGGGPAWLLAPLQQLSFWTMKERARLVGESGGHDLLAALQAATAGRDVRFHLMGHSFGCIVVSAMVAGPAGRDALRRPVSSMALVQGALSLWSYCADIPAAPGRAGYFHPLLAAGKLAGPIVTTQSGFDTAVGRLYPWAAGVRRQVAFDPNDLPTYGALGSFGAHGPGVDAVDLPMQPPDGDYAFAPGRVHNLEGSAFIREGGGIVGAHGDIVGPAVTHAVWEAARQATG
jgi:hypothetical protein